MHAPAPRRALTTSAGPAGCGTAPPAAPRPPALAPAARTRRGRSTAAGGRREARGGGGEAGGGGGGAGSGVGHQASGAPARLGRRQPGRGAGAMRPRGAEAHRRGRNERQQDGIQVENDAAKQGGKEAGGGGVHDHQQRQQQPRAGTAAAGLPVVDHAQHCMRVVGKRRWVSRVRRCRRRCAHAAAPAPALAQADARPATSMQATSGCQRRRLALTEQACRAGHGPVAKEDQQLALLRVRGGAAPAVGRQCYDQQRVRAAAQGQGCARGWGAAAEGTWAGDPRPAAAPTARAGAGARTWVIARLERGRGQADRHQEPALGVHPRRLRIQCPALKEEARAAGAVLVSRPVPAYRCRPRRPTAVTLAPSVRVGCAALRPAHRRLQQLHYLLAGRRGPPGFREPGREVLSGGGGGGGGSGSGRRRGTFLSHGLRCLCAPSGQTASRPSGALLWPQRLARRRPQRAHVVASWP